MLLLVTEQVVVFGRMVGLGGKAYIGKEGLLTWTWVVCLFSGWHLGMMRLKQCPFFNSKLHFWLLTWLKFSRLLRQCHVVTVDRISSFWHAYLIHATVWIFGKFNISSVLLLLFLSKFKKYINKIKILMQVNNSLILITISKLKLF